LQKGHIQGWAKERRDSGEREGKVYRGRESGLREGGRRKK
jgi:hypothetical protein